MQKTTVPCPNCGAPVASALVNNRRRMAEAFNITDRDERNKAIQRVNGEMILCPSVSDRNGGGN